MRKGKVQKMKKWNMYIYTQSKQPQDLYTPQGQENIVREQVIEITQNTRSLSF